MRGTSLINGTYPLDPLDYFTDSRLLHDFRGYTLHTWFGISIGGESMLLKLFKHQQLTLFKKRIVWVR